MISMLQKKIAVTNSRVDGLEARFNNLEAGSFSETTAASFGVDFVVVGAEDGAASEAAAFGYQMGIGLSSGFTGEDSLDVTIDIGDGSSGALAFGDTSDELTVDGLTPADLVGGATVMVGDLNDALVLYTLELVLTVLSLITWVTVEQEVLLE